MRRFALFASIFAIISCGDDSDVVPNPNTYQLVAPDVVELRQDSTVALRTLGFVVVRNGTDTIIGDGATALPRLSYFPSNTDVVIVEPLGIVRAIGPGTATVRVTGYDQEHTFTVNVRPYKATSVILRVLSFEKGGARPVAGRLDTGSFYALPSNSASARLEGLVMVENDTVFCNYCPTKTPARVNQRIVTIRSLDTTKITVTNAGTPTSQSSTGTTGFGLVTLDTTSTPVGVVMEVPSDDLADTVWIKLRLRPIDSIVVSPGEREVPAEFPDVGTETDDYPGDTLSANIVRSDLENFDADLTLRAEIRSIPATPGTGNLSWLTIGSTSRPFLPTVTWESALEGYLSINGVGGVVGSCEFIGRTGCVAPTRPAIPGGQSAAVRTQAARDSLVITCTDTGTGKRLPGLKVDGTPVSKPISFNPPVTLVGGRGMYRNTACPPVGGAPGPNIPMPGAFCTSATSTDRFSTCTVFIKASITDPVTNRLITYYYRINVRAD